MGFYGELTKESLSFHQLVIYLSPAMTHEKICLLHTVCEVKTKAVISCKFTTQLICAFGSRCIDSTIPLLPKIKISSLLPSSVAVQPGLCRTLSETPKTGFVVTRLIFCIALK